MSKTGKVEVSESFADGQSLKSEHLLILWSSCSNFVVSTCSFLGLFLTKRNFEMKDVWRASSFLLPTPETRDTIETDDMVISIRTGYAARRSNGLVV